MTDRLLAFTADELVGIRQRIMGLLATGVFNPELRVQMVTLKNDIEATIERKTKEQPQPLRPVANSGDQS